MKPLLAVGMAAVGGVIVFRCLPRERRDRLAAALGHRVTEHLGHMMDSLPEGAPPKLIMSVLPKLEAQNEQIIAILREQNELLRAQQPTAH
jgi:hypothetical protein